MSPFKNDGDPNGFFTSQLAALGFGRQTNVAFWQQLEAMPTEEQGMAFVANSILGCEATITVNQRKVGETIRDNVQKMTPKGAAIGGGGLPAPGAVPAAAAPAPVAAAPAPVAAAPAPVPAAAPAPVAAPVAAAPAPVAQEIAPAPVAAAPAPVAAAPAAAAAPAPVAPPAAAPVAPVVPTVTDPVPVVQGEMIRPDEAPF